MLNLKRLSTSLPRNVRLGWKSLLVCWFVAEEEGFVHLQASLSVDCRGRRFCTFTTQSNVYLRVRMGFSAQPHMFVTLLTWKC
jgi:hypothetical protein